MPEPIFKIRNITKLFGNHVVLNNINLDIFSGEILGVIGASGSGKTTLLNTVIGFLRPERGDVLFRQAQLLDFKQSITYRSVYKQRDVVKAVYGFAAQQPSFYDKLTVRENLEYFGSLYGLSKDAITTNVETLLTLMELKRSEKILAQNLSGGMERRLDIACSLMHDPEVLFLDEPTADLDPVLRDHIWDLIRKINKKGTTVVLASHHLLELEKLCSRILMLKNGKILEIGTPEDLKSKFSKGEEIIIETYPAEYHKLMARMKHKSISSMRVKATELHIKTSNAGKVLQMLLEQLDKLEESLIDIRVTKPNLDDIFFALSKEKPAAEKLAESQPQAKTEVPQGPVFQILADQEELKEEPPKPAEKPAMPAETRKPDEAQKKKHEPNKEQAKVKKPEHHPKPEHHEKQHEEQHEKPHKTLQDLI